MNMTHQRTIIVTPSYCSENYTLTMAEILSLPKNEKVSDSKYQEFLHFIKTAESGSFITDITSNEAENHNKDLFNKSDYDSYEEFCTSKKELLMEPSYVLFYILGADKIEIA